MFSRKESDSRSPLVPTFGEEQKKIVVTKLGTEASILMRSILNIDTDTEITNLLNSLEEKEIDSQVVRDQLSPLRDKLQAKISLLQALFAILPKERSNGYTGCSELLSKRDKH